MLPVCGYDCFHIAQTNISTVKKQILCEQCWMYKLPLYEESLENPTQSCDHCHQSQHLQMYLFHAFYCSIKCKMLDELKEQQLKGKYKVCAARMCMERAPLQCGRCRNRVYCSITCQRKDWSEHKPHCKPIRKGNLFTSWCWSHISLFLEIKDIVHLLIANTKLKVNNWWYLLERDYPSGCQVAKIEGYDPKQYYRELHTDTTLIREYITILEQEKKPHLVLAYAEKIIAKGSLQNLERLLTFDMSHEKKLRYLNWFFQLVKTNHVRIRQCDIACVVCWELYHNKEYLMWWLQRTLAACPKSSIRMLVDQKQFETILTLEEKKRLYFAHPGPYDFPFCMWIVNAYQESGEYQKAIDIMERNFMIEVHNTQEQDELLNRMQQILFLQGKYKEAYRICKQLLYYPDSKNWATLNIIQFRLKQLKNITKAKKYLKRLKYQVLSQEEEEQRYYQNLQLLCYLHEHKYKKFCRKIDMLNTIECVCKCKVLYHYFKKEYEAAITLAGFCKTNKQSFVTRYLARSYWKSHNVEAALKTLERYPDTNVKNLELAFMYVSLARVKKAHYYWARVDVNQETRCFDFEETCDMVKRLLCYFWPRIDN